MLSLYRRTASALALTSVILAGAALPAAAATDDERRREAEASVEHLREEIEETSRELAAAVRELREAEEALSGAQDAARAARERHEEAKRRDAELSAQLGVAVDQELTAQRELAVVEASVQRSRLQLAEIARTAYREGRVGDLTAYLGAEDPQDLTARRAYTESAAQSERTLLELLAQQRAEADRRRADLEARRVEVSALRAEAAATLVRMVERAREADDAERELEGLVAGALRAKRAVEREKTREERRLAAMEREAEALQSRLADRARRAGGDRRRVSAAARVGGLLATPVGGPVTSGFGMRTHPVTGVFKLHDGTDFGAACGTAVTAAADGVVLESGFSGAWGNRVVVEHGVVLTDGRRVHLATSYNHLSTRAVGAGSRVRRGQHLGAVGTTGYSTGCHLHFSVYVNGAPRDPAGWL
ncbi:MAG: peptidoglycan DD-metalloendopeptidase family protein [Actinomycetota bacterium]|nr:peptidoglycan DD-metalloendopeptidase family protein [Actinomycetota bacterium]